MTENAASEAAFCTISLQPEKKIPFESYKEMKERVIREALIGFPKVLGNGCEIDWEKVARIIFGKNKKNSQELKLALINAGVFIQQEDTGEIYFLVYEKRGGHDISLLYMTENYIKSDILVVNSRVNAMLLAQALEKMLKKQNMEKQIYVDLRANIKWQEYDPNKEKETKWVSLLPIRAGSTQKIK